MTSRRDLDPDLIARFLSGESTLAEAALVRAWAADPRRRDELEGMQRAWSYSFPLESKIDVDTAWRNVTMAMHTEGRSHDPGAPDQSPDRMEAVGSQRLHAAVRLARGGHAQVPRPALHRFSRRSHANPFTTIAAAAAVLVVTSVGILRVVRGTWPLTHAVRTNTSSLERTTQDFATRDGQRALIDLADGTHIVLAPKSKLHVSLPTGTSGQRELTLDGEALFTVTHDVAHPFVVHSRYGTTMDLGTLFAVRAYPGEPYRVVVREGQVALGVGVDAAVLMAGDVAAAADDGTVRVTHDPDAGALLDWTTGRLTFRHTRFVDLVPELERWYGVTIHVVTPSLRNRRITGQLDTESRAEAMAAIGRTLGAQHTTQGTHVTFSIREHGR